MVLALNGSVIALGQGAGAGLGGLFSGSIGLQGLALAGIVTAGTALLGMLIGSRHTRHGKVAQQ